MRQRILAGIILSLAVARVTAAPITYTATAFINGTLNGVAFFSNVTLRANSNTQSILWNGDCCFISTTSVATFSIEGVGSGTFTDFVHVISNPGVGLAGFVQPTLGGGQILLTDSWLLTGYDLSTPIGPITGDPRYSSGHAFPTSVGPLVFFNTGVSTFTAVPLSAALWLLGSALGVLGCFRRRVLSN